MDCFKVTARDYANFLRVDDEGNEIIVKVVEKGGQKQETIANQTGNAAPLTKSELIDILDAMIKNIEGLPQQAMSLPITHYDHCSLMILLSSILRST